MSATDRSFIKKSPTECDVCECGLKTSAVRSWSTRAVEPRKVHYFCNISYSWFQELAHSFPPPPTAVKSIFSQVQYALYFLIKVLSEELAVLVIFKLVYKQQEIWHFDGYDYEAWCILGYDAVLSDGNITTFQRNLLSSLVGYVTLLEMSWLFRKTSPFRDREAADSPESTAHAYQSTRRHVPEYSSLHCPSCHLLCLFPITTISHT